MSLNKAFDCDQELESSPGRESRVKICPTDTSPEGTPDSFCALQTRSHAVTKHHLCEKFSDLVPTPSTSLRAGSSKRVRVGNPGTWGRCGDHLDKGRKGRKGRGEGRALSFRLHLTRIRPETYSLDSRA